MIQTDLFTPQPIVQPQATQCEYYEIDAIGTAQEIVRIFAKYWPRANANRLELHAIHDTITNIISRMREGEPGTTWYAELHGITMRNHWHDALEICARVSPVNGRPSMWISADRNPGFAMRSGDIRAIASARYVYLSEMALPDIEPTYDRGGPIDPPPEPLAVYQYRGARIEKHGNMLFRVFGKECESRAEAEGRVNAAFMIGLSEWIKNRFAKESRHNLSICEISAAAYRDGSLDRGGMFWAIFREYSIYVGVRAVPSNMPRFARAFMEYAEDITRAEQSRVLAESGRVITS